MGSEPVRIETGAVVGRYVVLQQLGVGGMGVVHACYDPELDRKVALKVLRSDTVDGVARARLLREAQALAKLSHPNVVAIHDVGTVGEHVWLAIELVDGQTLRQWLETPRRWREVLEVMGAAGHGLAAAHVAGLSHRDFKPDNVMIGRDGRARVMDFGLARASGKTTEPASDTTLVPSVPPTWADAPVTRVGAIVGTPRYMAPEQLRGGRSVTGAADQFAFCVSAFPFPSPLQHGPPHGLTGRKERGTPRPPLPLAPPPGPLRPLPSWRRLEASRWLVWAIAPNLGPTLTGVSLVARF